MRRADWMQSTPVRLALAFAVMTIVALIAAGVIAYSMLLSELSDRRDNQIRETFAALEQTEAKGGRSDLIEAVTTRSVVSSERTSVFLLRDDTGRVLAGNIRAIDISSGWSEVSPEVLGLDTDMALRLFTGKIGTETLVVGLDSSEIAELREVFLSALGWSVVAVLAIALGGAAIIARRVQGRLVDIAGAMSRVAEGDLAARIPLQGSGDDIDRLSVKINDALARLSAVVEGMRQVSTDIAHDLRTPLNRLHLRIEDAIRHADAGLPVDDDLAAAAADSDAIGRTFSALLRIAQIEAGARREAFRPVDLHAVLGNVAEVYEGVAEDAGMSLTFTGERSAPIRGDAELLTQMFANMVENAIRHCPIGTAIVCTLVGSANGVEACVSDNGPGIAEAERDKVLQRLYRLEKSRTTPGSGLGLSLVKAVADLHGAVLTLADARPGLAVCIRFPLMDA